MKKNIKKYLPFSLSIFILVLDQLTKNWVIKNIPEGSLYKVIGNDLVWILHVRNTGAAFSMGAGTSVFSRIIFFVILPLILMVILIWFGYSKKNDCTNFQRWCIAGVLGGGLGTMADRLLRFDDGVVDFISVKFFGILGMDRWPTFNVSDSCVVVFVIIFAVTVLFTKDPNKK